MTNIQELGEYGISSQVIRIWEKSGIRSLLPVQQQAIEKGVLEGANLLVIAPTSSGKTFIGEIAAYKRAKEQAQVLYLVPLKAIGEEKFADFRNKYEDYGINVVISSSDHREFDDDIKQGNFHIAILTYEKLVALLVTNPEILRYCGLLIVDEIQMLADRTRGPELELLLTKVLLSREESDLQIIALSATLDGVDDLGKWLEVKVLRSGERPVELREGIYRPEGTFRYREWKSQGRGKLGEERFPSAEADYTAMVDTLVEYLVDKGEQVLVFLSTRVDTVTTAERLAIKVLSLPPVSEAIGALDELEGTSMRDTLKAILRGGVAFHNADLLAEERLLVERFFREGAIKVVCATSTLAMGVNMPAKTVIVADIWKWVRDERTQRWGRKPISVAEYKNASGRAGRYALRDDFGRSVLIAKTEFDHDSYWAKYVIGQLERVMSQFGEQPIDLQVLDLIASRICQKTEEAVQFLLKTFAGYQKWTLETTRQEIGDKIRDSIEKNIRAQTIERMEDGVLTATEQGLVCASKRISLETLEYLRKWLESVETIDELEAIYVAAQTKELARVSFRMSTPEFHSGKYIEYLRQIETERPVSSFITDGIPSDQQTLGYEKTKRLKMVLTAYYWTQGRQLRELEEAFQEKAGPIRRLTAENLSWIVDAMADLAIGCPREFAGQLEVIADRLVYGVPKGALFMARLRVRGINRSEMMQLLKHGYDSPDKILDADLSAFDGVISRTRANRFRSELRKHIKDTLERQKRGHITRLERAGVDSGILKSIYEAEGRALEMAMEDLFSSPFWNLAFERISKQDQREGRPDFLLYTVDDETIACEVTAKERNDHHIDKSKAEKILGSAAWCTPIARVVIGRPDFHELAVDNARNIVVEGTNYKLVPMYVLAEMYVRVYENRLVSEDVESILRNERGYLTFENLDKYSHAS